MSFCTCMESSYYSTPLPPLQSTTTHLCICTHYHWEYCDNITEIVWGWRRVVLERGTWLSIPQPACNVIDKWHQCPNSGFCFIWSPKNISVIHFSSQSQSGHCDCGFGQHVLRSAVHCGSATVAAFIVVILCWILLQWTVSRIVWSVYYCQWHWSALFLFIWVLIMYFWLKRGSFEGNKSTEARPVTLSGTKETGSCYCIRYQCTWTT